MQSQRDMHAGPAEPQSLEDTGLGTAFLVDLALKTLYFHGEMAAMDVAQELRLPFVNVTERILDVLKREALASITGGAGINEQTFRYLLTSEGARRAQEAAQRSQYCGPAPVPVTDYYTMVLEHTIADVKVTAPQVAQALAHLTLPPRVLDQLGPAINSGRSIFIYGPPGTGKSTIAEAMAPLLGGDVFIPHAIAIGGDVVQVFDPQVHVEAPPALADDTLPLDADVRLDARWVRCHRPLIVAGGELTLAALDLVYDAHTRYYEAPLQMKANGGMLLIDDFGRQLVRPWDLLNRWLVPLERRVDYLTLANGKKIQIPFDLLIVFSTNLDPGDLVDEAFLRRIRHKVEIPTPTVEEFRNITENVCEQWRVPFDEAGFQYLVREHYQKPGREFRGVHPRDLIQQLVDIAKYQDVPPEMTPELLDLACRSYFVSMQSRGVTPPGLQI